MTFSSCWRIIYIKTTLRKKKIFRSTYCLHAQLEPLQCFVAEAFEPHVLNPNVSVEAYPIVPESKFLYTDRMNRMKRTLVATISITRQGNLPDGWIHRFAIHHRFDIQDITEYMIQIGLGAAAELEYSTVEMTTTECQTDLRDCAVRKGFQTLKVYAKHTAFFGVAHIVKTKMSMNVPDYTTEEEDDDDIY